MSTMNLPVKSIPEGHVVVGHVVLLKCLDTEGEEYWATRQDGLNTMEAYGMVHSARDDYQAELNGMRRQAPPS
jgi:hypothetical protein